MIDVNDIKVGDSVYISFLYRGTQILVWVPVKGFVDDGVVVSMKNGDVVVSYKNIVERAKRKEELDEEARLKKEKQEAMGKIDPMKDIVGIRFLSDNDKMVTIPPERTIKDDYKTKSSDSDSIKDHTVVSI